MKYPKSSGRKTIQLNMIPKLGRPKEEELSKKVDGRKQSNTLPALGITFFPSKVQKGYSADPSTKFENNCFSCFNPFFENHYLR